MRDASADGSADGSVSEADAAAHAAHSEPDYAATAIPTDKPRSDYSYVERRADLYQQILDLGHPDHINQTEVAQMYDVDQSTVSRDLDRIAEYVRESRVDDLDRRALDVHASVSRAIRELQQTDDVADTERAAELAMEWAGDWCWDSVQSREIAEKLDDLGL